MKKCFKDWSQSKFIPYPSISMSIMLTHILCLLKNSTFCFIQFIILQYYSTDLTTQAGIDSSHKQKRIRMWLSRMKRCVWQWASQRENLLPRKKQICCQDSSPDQLDKLSVSVDALHPSQQKKISVVSRRFLIFLDWTVQLNGSTSTKQCSRTQHSEPAGNEPRTSDPLLHPSLQFFSRIETISCHPGLNGSDEWFNQYYNKKHIKCLAQGPITVNPLAMSLELATFWSLVNLTRKLGLYCLTTSSMCVLGIQSVFVTTSSSAGAEHHIYLLDTT